MVRPSSFLHASWQGRRRRAPELDPQQSLAVACDVCEPAQISALLRAALERFGRVDVWVNNAGFGLVDSIEHMDRQAYRRMFETNLFGAIEAMQQVIPVMKRQGSGLHHQHLQRGRLHRGAVHGCLRGNQARAECDQPRRPSRTRRHAASPWSIFAPAT